MVESEILFETRWLRLERIGHWDFVRRPHSESSVGILATTAAGEIVLVEQFRIPLQARVIELPAGIMGDEEEHRGESAADTAARELLEETGYRAGRITQLMETPVSAGMTSEMIHLFHATELTREGAGGGVGAEDIRVHVVPLAMLRGWLDEQHESGKIIDYKIHACLGLAGL
jgi:ADP-ribose pyrophosphatase